MANEKPTNARLQMKHDIEANWIIAGNATNPFVPKPGELIIYDVDDSHDSPRIKIGDGDNNVNELPFFVDEAKVDKDELLNANGTLKNDVLPEGYPYEDVGEILPEIVMPIDPEFGSSEINYEFELYIGNSYIVNYNGTEYNCEAKSVMMEGVELIALGNVGVMDESGETELTDEPFLLINMPIASAPTLGFYGDITPLDGAEKVTLSIHGKIIKKISKEFLPNIPNINNIADGSEFGSVRTILTSDVIGFGAHAEGLQTTAFGHGSHAEGGSDHKAFDFITEESTDEEIITAWNDNKFTLAQGHGSHAEGGNTLALGINSHAEGDNTLASSWSSHAEGYKTTASGQSSHAEGSYTIASSYASHVQGKYNIEDTENKYAHIVGNGTFSTRSNAHTLDWDGNAWFAGDVYVGSTSGKNKDEGSKKLVTEAELASLIAPQIPKQIQSDWNQNDETATNYIKNKPSLATSEEIKALFN